MLCLFMKTISYYEKRRLFKDRKGFLLVPSIAQGASVKDDREPHDSPTTMSI